MMNAISHCCVKANFIKAAKDNWVPCEVRLLTDDVDTFLCIKSRPLGFGQTEEDLKSIFSSVSNNGTISSANNPVHFPSVAPVTRAFTALCNLSEYKSCTVVTIAINDFGYFALKLVPAGIFGNKRLYLAMSSETEATTWMSMIKANLGKRKKANRNSLTQSRDSLTGTLRPSGSQDILHGDSSLNNRYDLDIDTIDNEVYEPCSAQDLIPAVIQQRGDWEKLRLSKMDCFLRLTDDRLELLDHNGERVLHWFPYLLIRRFGAVGGVLRVDAGRRCSTGDGHFFFTCSPSNGQPVDAIVSQIRQLALEAKQRLRQEQASRQQMLQQHIFPADSGAASLLPPPVPSKTFSFDNSTAKTLGKLGNRSPSPKGLPRGSSTSIGSNNNWWSGGSYKRSSSQPARKQVEEALDKISPQTEEEVQQTKSAISLQKTVEKPSEEKNGVFIATPGKATTQDVTTNGTFGSIDSTASTPSGDLKDAPINGNHHQPSLYDNVPTTSSETLAEKVSGTTPANSNSTMTSTTTIDGWHLDSSLKAPRLDGKRLDDTNLPPPPPPPTSPPLLPHLLHSTSTAPTNDLRGGGAGDNKAESQGISNGTTPSPVALKPLINYSPKNIDLANYRQPNSSRLSWLTGVSNMRSYRPYRDGSSQNSIERDFNTNLTKSPHRTTPPKSLSFGSGVYETEEQSANDRVSLNMRGLDEVLQELREANQNVTSAVQAAERQRRDYGLSTPYHIRQQHQQQQQSAHNMPLRRSASPTSAWTFKRDI
ncbi:hypothetical protein Aperf_G00000035562 [Anoplocephala perfoliata]